MYLSTIYFSNDLFLKKLKYFRLEFILEIFCSLLDILVRKIKPEHPYILTVLLNGYFCYFSALSKAVYHNSAHAGRRIEIAYHNLGV